MQIFLLVVAAVLTLLFIPLVHAIEHGGPEAGMAAIGIVFLQLLRAGALIAGLLVSGRIGITTSIAGVVAMEVTCCALHFLSMDYEMQPAAQIVFAALATLIPALLLTAGFLNARPLYLTAVGLSILTGLTLLAAYDSLAAPYREIRANELQAAEEKKETRTAELAALPEDAPVEALLPFLAATEPPSTSGAAAFRLQRIPSHIDQLVQQLQTPRRLLALYALRPDMATLTAAQADQCWQSAGELASSPSPTWAEVEMLNKSALSLVEKRKDWRERHRTEAQAVSDAVHLAGVKGTYLQGADWLDSYLGAK